jgi:hypothetical protein
MVLEVGAAAHVSIRVSIVQPSVLEGRDKRSLASQASRTNELLPTREKGRSIMVTERGNLSEGHFWACLSTQ